MRLRQLCVVVVYVAVVAGPLAAPLLTGIACCIAWLLAGWMLGVCARKSHQMFCSGGVQQGILCWMHAIGVCRYVAEMRARVPPDISPPPTRIVDKMLRNLWLVG